MIAMTEPEAAVTLELPPSKCCLTHHATPPSAASRMYTAIRKPYEYQTRVRAEGEGERARGTAGVSGQADCCDRWSRCGRHEGRSVQQPVEPGELCARGRDDVLVRVSAMRPGAEPSTSFRASTSSLHMSACLTAKLCRSLTQRSMHRASRPQNPMSTFALGGWRLLLTLGDTPAMTSHFARNLHRR